jgi:EcsC protein family
MQAVDKAKERLLRLYLDELGRARRRVDELRDKFPAATNAEMVQRLIASKKTWAGTGGAVSGLFGLFSLPADIALVTALQLSLIIEIAVLHRVNLKSERARQEVIDLLGYANGFDQLGVAARTGPKLVARVAQVLLARKGLVSLGRALPVLAAPISAHINNRDIQRAGEAALRYYGTMRNLAGRKRAASEA